MKKVFNWIKRTWKHPFWGGLYGSFVFSIVWSIGSLILGLVKQIPWKQAFFKIWDVLSQKISVPIYIIGLIMIIGVYVYARRDRKELNKSTKSNPSKPIKTKSKSKLLTTFDINTKVFKANGSHVPCPSTSFLKEDIGVFNIWAEVDTIHNQIHPRARYMYIIGHSKGKGNPGNNPSLAAYPSAWSISRLTPTQNDHYGIWRFWCNNISNDLTHLDYTNILPGGWHIFSVSWSNTDNYIKFLIDGEIASQSEFKNWPTSFDKELSIGTWPDKHGAHNYDARIGPANFTRTVDVENCIKEFLKFKPE